MGRIRVCDAPLPSELPETVEGFLRWLGGPALLRRRGRDPSRLRAVATLLHGNEPSGIRALHRWLASGQVPYAGAAIFIGSVEAALADPGFHHRALPGRRDLNRCFVPPCDGDEPEVAHEALALLDSLGPESLADLHNTSGETPPFALGPTLDAPHLAIAGCFCTRYVWSDLRIGSLVEATHAGYPSIVVECGRFADPAADEVAYRGLVRYLSEEPASSGPEPSREIFRSSVRVCLRPGLGLAFGEAPHPRADVTVMPALDHFNFRPLPRGALLGWARATDWPLVAEDAQGTDISRELFELRDGRLTVRSTFTPVMATSDLRAAGADCLFYAAFPADVVG